MLGHLVPGPAEQGRRGGEPEARYDLGFFLDQKALDDDRARTDEHAVLEDDRPRARGLEDAADADATREMTIPPDLRAAPDRRPWLDHCTRPHLGPDVHETLHHVRPRLE